MRFTATAYLALLARACDLPASLILDDSFASAVTAAWRKRHWS